MPSHTDVAEFLKKMSKDLDNISSSTGWCKPLNEVLTVRMTEMGAILEWIREKARQLCATPGERTTSEFSQRSGYYMFRYSHKCVINMCICIASIERKARLLLLLLLQSRTQQ